MSFFLLFTKVEPFLCELKNVVQILTLLIISPQSNSLCTHSCHIMNGCIVFLWDGQLFLQLHHLQHPDLCSPTSKTGEKDNAATNRYPFVMLGKKWIMNESFFVNKLGFQPAVIAQAYWNHRLSTFTQADICIRLFACVCPLWHDLLVH